MNIYSSLMSIVPGDFCFVNDKHDAEMLADGYNAITDLNLWNWLENYTPEKGEGFMFSNHENITKICNAMKNSGSGATFSWTMRNMEYIAKHGWETYVDEYKKRVPNQQEADYSASVASTSSDEPHEDEQHENDQHENEQHENEQHENEQHETVNNAYMCVVDTARPIEVSIPKGCGTSFLIIWRYLEKPPAGTTLTVEIPSHDIYTRELDFFRTVEYMKCFQQPSELPTHVSPMNTMDTNIKKLTHNQAVGRVLMLVFDVNGQFQKLNMENLLHSWGVLPEEVNRFNVIFSNNSQQIQVT